MTDELNNPADGEAMPEAEFGGDAQAEAVELDADIDGDDQDAEGVEVEGEEPEEEGDAPQTYTVKVNGEEREVTLEELQSGYMFHSDYTRKTQEVAETRKQAEQRLERLNQIATMSEQEIQGRSALMNLDAQISQIQNMNLEQLSQSDPIQAQQLGFRLQKLVQQRGQIEGGLRQHSEQLALMRKEEIQRAQEQGRAELAKKIKGYNAELENKLADFGTEYGFDRQEILDAVEDPRSIEILHLAYLGKQALAQQKKTKKLAAGQRTKPVKSLRGSGGQFAVAPDTNDFSKFEKLADKVL